MAFTERLAKVAEPIFDTIVGHPMVQGIGDGSLDKAPFRYWVKQDYVYLIEYDRVFALGAAKAPDLERMGRFADLLHETLHTEMDLHRSYAEDLGIPADELEATERSPTTQGYTDFLVRTAALGTFGDLVAALLPCMWGFHETGTRLAAQGRPADPHYADWIDMYASDEFAQLTDWCKDLMDEVADGQPDRVLDRYEDRFVTSARYEHRFWDAAWRQESWGV